jgi:hypothetical protein
MLIGPELREVRGRFGVASAGAPFQEKFIGRGKDWLRVGGRGGVCGSGGNGGGGCGMIIA